MCGGYEVSVESGSRGSRPPSQSNNIITFGDRSPRSVPEPRSHIQNQAAARGRPLLPRMSFGRVVSPDPTAAGGGRGVRSPAVDEIELTDDEHLRALAALEAVVGNDDGALAVLAGGAGERPLPVLLAVYGKHMLERILVAAFGITATTDHDAMGPRLAELNADPQARLTFLLTDALHHQAALAAASASDVGLVTAKRIGISVLEAVHAFTDADDSEALTLLRALRNEVLRPG